MPSEQPAVPLCPDDGVCSSLAAVVRFAEQLKVVLAVQSAFVQWDDMVGLKPLAPPAAGNSAALEQLGYRLVKATLAVFADRIQFAGAAVAGVLAPGFRVSGVILAAAFPFRFSVGSIPLVPAFLFRISVGRAILAFAFPYRISVGGVILAFAFPPALRALPPVPPLAAVPFPQRFALAALAEIAARVG